MAEDQHADEVEEPADGRTDDDPEDAEDQVDHVLAGDALSDTVDGPDDVDDRQAKKDLNNLGEIVDGLAEFFHVHYLLKVGYIMHPRGARGNIPKKTFFFTFSLDFPRP